MVCFDREKTILFFLTYNEVFCFFRVSKIHRKLQSVQSKSKAEAAMGRKYTDVKNRHIEEAG